MIVFDLSCHNAHRFEGWFGSSDDFNSQQERGLVSCPHCGSGEIIKAPMAPAVSAKANRQAPEFVQPELDKPVPKAPITNGPLPPEISKAMKKLAEVQAKALKDSKWVGKDFAEKSRAIHYGEDDKETIHGETTLEEAKDLLDEGIAVSPLPFPVSPPEDLN
ncbi:DUF1178 family protein [Pontixanthobacter aestiaquae]|uniref:DUF1178 family protein n=1 Tax=Pontixanthobacter aestiaquae TaxID=1509367 RepID=A0A844Z8K0_9SPHN|nr:DUF1178 family protein [Pontixanthobacter aestiaquae]MDN3645357.1 DUF1178 family protein [Pontixanthobacter aestiaquae]MXO83642.1 DUF1178 family protein [Pontixanthobacter aestiaquae]